jgi:hypothetical protein
MRSLQSSRNRLLSVAVGAALSFACASVSAETGTKEEGTSASSKRHAAVESSAQESLGIMSFANVHVVNETPQSAPATSAKPNSAALRAYLDPKTGRLRSETAEDRVKNAQQQAAREAAKASTPRGALDVQGANTGARTLYGPSGAIGVELTEEHMIYQVAHRTHQGLVREEVTGKSAAKQVVKKTEVTHER